VWKVCVDIERHIVIVSADADTSDIIGSRYSACVVLHCAVAYYRCEELCSCVDIEWHIVIVSADAVTLGVIGSRYSASLHRASRERPTASQRVGAPAAEASTC